MDPAPVDFAALFLRHRGTMYGVAHSVLRGTGHESAAEDVVMETMATLMERPPVGVTNWEAFLVRATRNKAVDVLRSAAVRHAGGPVDDHDTRDRTASVEDDVIERVDVERDGARVWDALSVLDERERQILWRYKALGQSRADVAAEFGVSPARVSQISTQALKTLQSELSKEGLRP